MDYKYDASRRYTFEDYSHDDMEMVKEMYNDGLTDVDQLAIEQDLGTDTIIQILDTLKRRNEI